MTFSLRNETDMIRPYRHFRNRQLESDVRGQTITHFHNSILISLIVHLFSTIYTQTGDKNLMFESGGQSLSTEIYGQNNTKLINQLQRQSTSCLI